MESGLRTAKSRRQTLGETGQTGFPQVDSTHQPVPGSNFVGSGISGVITRQLSPVSQKALKSLGAYNNSSSGVMTGLPSSLWECIAASRIPLTSKVRSTGYGDS